MYPSFVVALFLMVCAMLSDLAMKHEARADSMRTERVRREQTRIAEGIDQYMTRTGVAPASLDALVATTGFEDLRTYRNPWQGYVASGSINDGTWRFQRAAAWTVIRRDGGATYRTENACGSGDAALALSWCGRSDGVWFRAESRETFAEEMAQQRVRQSRTLQMLADHFTAKQLFPRQGVDGVSLASGQMRTLPQLVGFAGAAGSCTGVYVWSGMPLDCSALFDVWGNPVGYQYQSDRFVVLVSESPIRTAAGARVIVASPLQVQE